MPGSDQQVVSMYEFGQLSPEEIAQSLQLDVLAVRNCLLQYSRLYREAQKNPAPLTTTIPVLETQDVTDDDFQLLRQAALSIALGDPEQVGGATKGRMIRFLWDEKKGRNNSKGQKGPQVGVILLTQNLALARQAVEKALLVGSNEGQEVIELEKVA